MIICHRGRFVFFHNPKVAGASVHKSLEALSDSEETFWRRAPDGKVRAHYGIDEFAADEPAIWARTRDYQLFALWRDPYERFLSSFGQHSKMYGAVDIRFATQAQVRDYLDRTIDRLEALGSAEAVMPEPSLTAFRPQWIYLTSADKTLSIKSFPLSGLAGMFAAIEARIGAPVERVRINEKERLDLPGPLARLLGQGGLVRRLGKLPGAAAAKNWLKRNYSSHDSGLKIDPHVENQLRAFVGRFYRRDVALLDSLAPDAAGQRAQG